MIYEEDYNKLIEVISYLSDGEIRTVKEAIKFATEKHFGQIRLTGEPYIVHPLEVALIVTEVYADCDTIVSAILHDVLEDTSTTKEEIENLFGKTVAKLVDGVTKINNINVLTDNDYLTAYYKKIIVGMSEDVRVIIIKLADRLHNMRTLYVLPKEKQRSKAKETLEILAPIAHHLGMNKIKSELEDLCLKYLKPDAYYDILEKLNNTKLEREEYVKQMMDEISEFLRENDIKHEIKGRVKSVYSIYKKLDKGRTFSNIYDILAIRIFVDKEQDCYLALGLIHSKYKPVSKRFKDYIAMPKTNLYQSLHTTVFGPDGNLFEVQIRTYEMDEIAENGIASHWAYKENKNAALEMQNITEQKLQFYKSIIELNEEKITNEEYIKKIKDEVLNNSIYVYTPKGDVIELPAGSTPIDFAYKVHTQVGNKMVNAIVNDKIVPLTTELKNNDILKIETNSSSKGPSREWINIAKTTTAKSKIKAFFSKTEKEENLSIGKEALEKELKKNKISKEEFFKEQNINKILKEYKENDLDDLYLDIASGKYSIKSIIFPKKENENKIIDANKSNKPLFNDIIVSGSKNIKTHISNCCYPVPGDEIIGHITRKNSIAIHRKNCPVLGIKEDKIIPVSWEEETNNKYTTNLLVYSKSSDNLMLDILQKASEAKVMVESIDTINKDINKIYKVVCLVNNLLMIENFIKKLEKIKNISTVERMFL